MKVEWQKLVMARKRWTASWALESYLVSIVTRYWLVISKPEVLPSSWKGKSEEGEKKEGRNDEGKQVYTFYGKSEL